MDENTTPAERLWSCMTCGRRFATALEIAAHTPDGECNGEPEVTEETQTELYQKISGEQLDGMTELFRVVTDGCGNLYAVDGDELIVLGKATIEVNDEVTAHRVALHALVDEIAEDLVDPN